MNRLSLPARSAGSGEPALTSVRQPVEEMTTCAARELLHGRVDGEWHQSFPVSLQVRASTGAPST